MSWDKGTSKWKAGAKLNGKQIYLGLFATPEEASAAYQDFAKQNHQEFLYKEVNTNGS